MSTGPEILVVGLDNFKEEVVRSDLPVLVEFYADWCPLCGDVERLLEAFSREYSGRMKFVRVSTDTEKEISGIYDVQRRPTVIVLKKGILKERIVGVVPEWFYRERIEAVLQT